VCTIKQSPPLKECPARACVIAACCAVAHGLQLGIQGRACKEGAHSGEERNSHALHVGELGAKRVDGACDKEQNDQQGQHCLRNGRGHWKESLEIISRSKKRNPKNSQQARGRPRKTILRLPRPPAAGGTLDVAVVIPLKLVYTPVDDTVTAIRNYQVPSTKYPPDPH